MDEQRYVVVDIHPKDACFEGKDEFLGKIVEIRNVQQSKASQGYLECDAKFIIPIQDKYGHTTRNMYFYAVQLQTLEDNKAENGRIVEP